MAYIWLVNVNVATATGSTGTPLKVGTLNTQGGFTFNICGGAFFGGNSGATIPATIWLLNTGVVQVGCEAHRMTTEPYGVLIQDDGVTASGGGDVYVKNLGTEGTIGAVVTTYNAASTGPGIHGIFIDNVEISDCAATCYLFNAVTAGTANTGGVVITNSGGGQLLAPGITSLQGLVSQNNFEVSDNSPTWLPTSVDTVVREPGLAMNLYGSSATSTVLATQGATCLGCSKRAANGAVQINSGDVSLHVVDDANGGTGGSTAYGNVARFESGSTAASVSFESPNNGLFTLNFANASNSEQGGFYYNHGFPQAAIIKVNNSAGTWDFYGSSAGNNVPGDFTSSGRLCTTGSSNQVCLAASPTAFRTQNLPDASGTVALTNQLPLAATTSSIGGSALAAGSCTSGTVSVTGATTSMAVAVSPAADPGVAFTWHAWVSAAGTVSVRVCNISSASATPTSAAYNVRVAQ